MARTTARQSPTKPTWLTVADILYPARLRERLGANAPPQLTVLGNLALLALPKTALFCSARTPGDAILSAHGTAQRLRDEGATVISGFHSPIEKECLRILLRGKQPIILCPARAIARMRLPAECRTAFDAGRLLFLSPFIASPRRVTRDTALRRNEMVAALADQVFIAHIASGSRTAHMADMLKRWGVPFLCPL